MSLKRFFAIGASQIRPVGAWHKFFKVNRVIWFNKNLVFNDNSLKLYTELKYILKNDFSHKKWQPY